MKLQHLAIIFVIIMLPISMVVTVYIQTQIDTISLQSKYSTELQTATHDAIKAFQLNTINNKYSSLSDSKIRDIEASINTFYNSLGTEFGASGYDKDSLQAFIPAIVYTMYDGYYIYGKYYNEEIGDYQYGLKPYIYYSCRYKNNSGTYDFVVNYTLDNNITVYGKIGDLGYLTKSGTLINPSLVELGNKETVEYTDLAGNYHKKDYVVSLKYNGIDIEKEILQEQLALIENNVVQNPKYYEYVTYNNRKVYFDKDNNSYFWLNKNEKQNITDIETLAFVQKMTINGKLYSNSAVQYYAEAYEFSTWVNQYLARITQEDAVDENGKQITDFVINTKNEKIFKLDNNNNNPMLEDSIFNQNRISVIRRTIQTTLNTAIANYSSNANYEFAMPVFTEEDWDKLVNNISVATFMQGIPIGAKYFNNYCVITNNKNKEFISKDTIYIITDNNNNGILENDDEIHTPASIDVIDNNKKVIAAYKGTEFEMQTFENNGVSYAYYPHANSKCYDCMVNVSQSYSIDDIINGEVKVYNKNTDTYEKDTQKSSKIAKLRKIYLTALAREKYDLYKTNSYFGS